MSPPSQPGALDLFEHAFAFLRFRPASILAPYWIGTAPFLAALIMFVFEMSGSAFAAENLLPWSFVVAVLWIWMNVWQAIYCERIRWVLSREVGAQIDRDRISAVLRIQSATQGLSLVALPVSLLALLPLPWTYGFFQAITCLAAQPGAELGATWHRARESASFSPAQSWRLMGIASLLAGAVFVNIAVGAVLVSQFGRSLLGITSPFLARPDAFFNSTFVAFVAAATYLTVDPVLKAVFTVRCFAVESVHSGADLRVSLKQISATVLALVIVCSTPARANTPAITTGDLDQAIDQVLRDPQYSWRMPREVKPPGQNTLLERAADSIAEGFRKIGQAISLFVDWLLDLWLDDIGPPVGGARPPSRSAARLMIFLLLLLVPAIAFAAWRLRVRKAVPIVEGQQVIAAKPVDVASEDVSAAQLPQDEWLRLADDLLAKGDTRLALRALFLGALARLAGDGLITLARFKTNLEYDRELVRRARALPQVRSEFRTLLQTFEPCWYGPVIPDEATVMQMRSIVTQLGAHA